MKKLILILLSFLVITANLFAGGILTNTNQSAAFARMLARDASLGIDAVYFNPAGLTKLNNGFHLSLNNQSIFQSKVINSDYSYLKTKKFTGDVSAPLFPGVYAVYKTGKIAASLGFNPIGGGGGAKYKSGLPSFEMGISDLIPMLATTQGVTGYSVKINFEGTSVFYGIQAGLSYEINPMISVFVGGRYVIAKNTYNGTIKDIMINPNIPNTIFLGTMVRADSFGIARAAYYNGVATQLSATASGLQPLIDGGAGSFTLAQAEGANLIDAGTRAQLEAGLASIGQPTTLTITQTQGAFSTAATGASAGADQMSGLAAGAHDKTVNATQTGSGITPILSANFTLMEKLNIGIKYEFHTKLELTNKTKADSTGMFPDGEKNRNDLPAMLSIGASYPVLPKLNASVGFHYFFDKSADYGKKEGITLLKNKDIIDKNYIEVAVGLEYHITDKILASVGYLRSQTGVKEIYQSDIDHSLSSNTIGLGGAYSITPKITVNIGGLYTMYSDGEKSFSHTLGTNQIPVKEKYSESNVLGSIGVDINFDK